jgi:hypothetical protein
MTYRLKDFSKLSVKNGQTNWKDLKQKDLMVISVEKSQEANAWSKVAMLRLKETQCCLFMGMHSKFSVIMSSRKQ